MIGYVSLFNTKYKLFTKSLGGTAFVFYHAIITNAKYNNVVDMSGYEQNNVLAAEQQTKVHLGYSRAS